MRQQITHMCDMTHSYVCHDSFVCVPWLIHKCDMTRLDSCDNKSHICLSHMNGSCHTYEWVMSHIWMSHVTHMYESRHTYVWVTSHIWMSHVTHMNESCHTDDWVSNSVESRDKKSIWIDKSSVNLKSVSNQSSKPCTVLQDPSRKDLRDNKSHMGWLWLAGSIKLYVSFEKEPYKRDDILQKRPII